MAWFARRDAEAETPVAPDADAADSRPAIPTAPTFEPGPPIDDWGPVDAPATAPGAAPAPAVPALEWAVKVPPPRPALAPRTAMQEKMAEIAEKHKDGPISDMAGPIRDALAAHGREVPDDWIVAIAEGLRQHGPISLNLGGPGGAAP